MSLIPLRRLAQGGGLFTDGDWIESPYITDAGVRLIQTGNVGVGEYREQGGRYVSQATFRELRCTEVRPGDVLICRLAEPVGRSCLAPDLGVRMITSVDVAILRPRPDLADARFVNYWCSSALHLAHANSIARGGTRQRISREQLGSLPIPQLPLSEQTAIADFLDRETARINDLIADKHRMVELLEERIDAVIMTEIGGSKIAQPGGIELEPLRRQLEKLDRPPEPDGEMITAFRDGQVTTRSQRGREEGFTESWTDAARVQGVEEGDVVIHGLDGFAGAIGYAECAGVCSPVYHVCRPIQGEAVYFGRLLRLLATTGYLGNFATSTRERAVDFRNWDLFGRIPIPTAPAEVQVEISQKIRNLRPLKVAVERSALLAAEFKQALITAAVTRELDLSKAA